MPTPVYRDRWDNHGFNKDSAVKVYYEPTDGQVGEGEYSYYINMDNVYLLAELKSTKEDLEIVRRKWQFGMVLIGMALLRESAGGTRLNGYGADAIESDDGSAVQRVFEITAALSPILLPLIEHLGALSEDQLVGSL